MKIAVTSQGTDLDSQVDPRFGRASHIIIVDSETGDFQVIDNNENVNAMKGAGIQAATTIVDNGAEVLLTGFCGPNAFKALKAGNVKVANDASGSVKEAVKAFMDGKMTMAESAKVDGHW